MVKKETSSERFIDNNDGTVTDTKTGLIWMQQNDGERRTWDEAKTYCEANEAKLPGKDWRLPTVEELFSLVDYSRFNPAINPIFKDTKSSYYWSSTPHASYSGYAWYVYFGNGGVYWYSQSSGHYVRAVRQNSLII